MVFDTTLTDPISRIQAYFDAALSDPSPDPSWDYQIVQATTPLTASLPTPKTCVASFHLRITGAMCNVLRNLHGGCAATIFDLLTSMAVGPLAAPGKFEFGGVSRTLNCTYLRPTPEGQDVVVECEVLALSGRLSMMRGTLRKGRRTGEGRRDWVAEGPVLCLCEHGKVNTEVPRL